MTLDRALADVPRWMFLLILIFAPWAYGCTDRTTLAILNQFSAALLVLWLVGCVGRRRWPQVPGVPVAVVTLLLLQGWWLAWNAHSYHVYRTWTTVTRLWDHPPLPDWPGAIDRPLAQLSMLNVTALAGLFLFATDLMTRSAWRKRVWATMALTAVSLAVGGVVLKLAWPEAREWLWGKEVAKLATTFATYRYHGNAASLLSIGWALALGFTVVAVTQRGQPVRLALWSVALLGLLFGLFINTSRAGWGLAVLLGLLIGARFLWAWWRTRREHFAWKPALLQAVLMLAVIGVLLTIAMGEDRREKFIRLQTAAETLQERYPTKVYHELARETGWLGYGADCFQVALPAYLEALGLLEKHPGFWRHAHNDYYEYLANWGRWGGALWAVLIGGGLWLGWRDHFRTPMLWGSTQWVLGFCGCAAILGILLHAFWDFPLEKASILLYFLTLVADGWARPSQPGEFSSADESS